MASVNHAAYTVRRCTEAGNFLTLEKAGQKLSERASELCFLLAACEGSAIPAFLFSRAYLPQRRWLQSGEIAEIQPNISVIPRWVPGLFKACGVGNATNEAKPVFDFTSLGMRPYKSTPRYVSVPEDIQALCSDHVLSTSLENDYLHFELIRSFKAQIRRAFGDGEWVYYKAHLVPLVVLAFPDLYAEPLWHVIKSGLGDLIQSTIFPFLATIEWEEMMAFEPILTELLLFLTQYAISQGIHIGSGLPFKAEVLTKLHQYFRNDLSIIEYCVLKDRIFRFLLDSVPDDRSFTVLRSQTSQRHQGFLGFAIDFLMRSTYSFEISNKLLKLGIRWLPNRTNGLSTITGVAGLLVSSSTTLKQEKLFGLFNYDHHIKATLGFELNQRNHQITAKFFLATSLESIEDDYTGRSLEYGLFSAEFVKSCLMLEHWIDGELLANRAILHFARGDLSHRLDTVYLKIGLSYLLIRQDRLDQAETILADLTRATISCPHLTAIIALSANEVWRRLDKIEALYLGKHRPLWNVLERFDDVENGLKVGFLDELSATIIKLNQYNSINFQETRSMVIATINHFSKNRLLKSNARFALFRNEFSIFSSEDSIPESLEECTEPLRSGTNTCR